MKSIPAASIGNSLSVSDPSSRQSATALCNALGTIGFAYLYDHGISVALIEYAFAASRDFHTSAQELKVTLAINGVSPWLHGVRHLDDCHLERGAGYEAQPERVAHDSA